jgi:hypothetical protein
MIPEHPIDLGHRPEALRFGLGGATGHHDAHIRALAAQPPNGLTRLAHRLGGDRTGIDDDGVGQSRRGRLGPDHLGLMGVEPAPEADHIDRHSPPQAAPALANAAGSKRPRHSNTAGPVMST